VIAVFGCTHYLKTHIFFFLILFILLATKLYSIFKALKQKMEQKILHAIMLYEFKLGHNVTDTSENINRAWSKKTTTERTVRRWFQRFQNGDLSLEEASGRGRSAFVDNDYLRTIVESNPRTTVCDWQINLVLAFQQYLCI
jgi:hypothetical protein